MAITVKKVTTSSSTKTKGQGSATPVTVVQPSIPADYQASTYNGTYKQGNYNASKYNGTYNPKTYKSGYKQGTYNSKYQKQVDAALNNVVNWNYDPMQDANYQALAKVYNAQGNLAAKNSLADAAALNGGYGTSYAASAAQQARNQYNQQLASMIPELEQMAYQRAQTTYNTLMDADNTAYGRYRDTESDKQWKESHNLDVFNTNEQNRYNAANFKKDVFSMNEDNRYRAAAYNQDERQFAANYGLDKWKANQDQRQFAYNALLDKYNTLNSNYWQGLNYNYQLDRDRVSDERWAMEYALANSGSGGGGGSGGRGRRSSGGGGGYTSSGGNDNNKAIPDSGKTEYVVNKRKGNGSAGSYVSYGKWNGTKAGGRAVK